jgi:hypothetical protein
MAATTPHFPDAEKQHKRVLEAEAESIQEAIEVGSSHDGEIGYRDHDDLEKASTTHSKTNHDPATRVVTAQDWNGPDDPDNPHNWGRLKKACHCRWTWVEYDLPTNMLTFAQSGLWHSWALHVQLAVQSYLRRTKTSK